MSLLPTTTRLLQRHCRQASWTGHALHRYLRQTTVQNVGISSRYLASSPPSPLPDENDDSASTTDWLRDANPKRIRGIRVNPDSVGDRVLPGNLVYKKYKFSGNVRKIPLELDAGYFWMMWDLRKSEGKPTLPNESLIPEEDAQLFPVLTGLKTLNGEKADLPFFFVDQHGELEF